MATYEYDAFGNAEALGGEATDNPFRYNGQYYDEETGLIYLRNRYYDPEIGRFISEDPYWNVSNMIYGNREYEEDEIKTPDYSAIVQSANLYVYCMNDPVNLFDLFGEYAYEHFDSIEETIQDWAWNNCGYTRETGNEKGATIFAAIDENGNLYYSYTWTAVGGYGYVDVVSTISDMPVGAYFLGFVHTHYKYNYISYDDKTLARDYNTSIYMVYVENGQGFVNKYGRDRTDNYTETVGIYNIYGYASWASLKNSY